MEGREGRREEWRFEDWTGSGRRRELGKEGGREGGAETEKKEKKEKETKKKKRGEGAPGRGRDSARVFVSRRGFVCGCGREEQAGGRSVGGET